MFGLFSKRPDPSCLQAAGRKAGELLADGLRTYSNVGEVELEAVDDATRKIVEAQMMVVSFTTSLLNYTLIDAYYDAGLADPISGMPKMKFDHQDSRLMLHEAWSIFPTARMNLDMRYRYIFIEKLLSPAEQDIWLQIEAWSEHQARWHFEMKQPLAYEWAAFVRALGEANVAEAHHILRVR